MRYVEEPMPWTREMNVMLARYLEDAAGQLVDADKRHDELIRAHREGWKLVAEAIGKGLGQIAEAIRRHGR